MVSRRDILIALLIREDLLPSNDWPWTTDELRAAYTRLLDEEQIVSAARRNQKPGAALANYIRVLKEKDVLYD